MPDPTILPVAALELAVTAGRDIARERFRLAEGGAPPTGDERAGLVHRAAQAQIEVERYDLARRFGGGRS